MKAQLVFVFAEAGGVELDVGAAGEVVGAFWERSVVVVGAAAGEEVLEVGGCELFEGLANWGCRCGGSTVGGAGGRVSGRVLLFLGLGVGCLSG